MPASKTASTRVRKLNIKQKKKVARKIKTTPGAFRLFGRACRHIWTHKKLFGIIMLIYLALYFVLVKGFATGFQLGATRQALEEVAGNEIGGFETAAALFGALVGTAGSASGEASAVYQALLFIIMSLVIIWALRQTYDNRQQPGVKSVFYNSSYPLVPYILIMLLIILELIPALLGTLMYGITTNGGIAVGVLENVLWFLFLLVMISVSVFMLSSTLFASYIVTLPGMTPMKALRSARKLVRFRRFIVIRKALFLPLIVIVLMTAFFLPLVFYATAIAEAVFLVFSLLLLLLAHTYFYVLYRELL